MDDAQEPRLSRWRRRIRTYVGDANDGIVSTAGLLEGFSGAGASEATLLLAAVAATIAGALALAGATFDELTSEREEQLALIEKERRELAERPDDEVAELAAYYEQRGLTAALARQVAEQLNAADPLTAQLETEYGIHEAMPRRGPLLGALGAAAGFITGSVIPLLILVLFADPWESWVIYAAVVLALGLTSVLSARAGDTSIPRSVVRTVTIGVTTIALGYLTGNVLF